MVANCGYVRVKGNFDPLDMFIGLIKAAFAAVLTVFFPGVGHIYKGYVGNGVLWLLITWPLCGIGVGFILWIWLIFRAYKIDVA